MGLKGEESAINQYRKQAAFRIPAAYGVGSTTIFTIQGGPVLITGLMGIIVGVPFGAGGTTMRFTVCGIAVDTAVAVAGAANILIVSPLDDTGGTPVVVAAVSNNPLDRMFAGPGNIQVVVAIAPSVGTVGFYCTYYRLDPASNIL